MRKPASVSMALLVTGVLVAAVSPVRAQVPEKLKALVGTYSGEWAMYGMDNEGKIVEKFSWTDVIEVSNPVVKDGKACVTTVDRMNFGVRYLQGKSRASRAIT
ncbi:MAG: hypothetical protein RB296_12840 [Acidobacteriota bacterium]|nr:hypothetical protein [Acidobacteriota bacterium]